jgi:hypothetical protein
MLLQRIRPGGPAVVQVGPASRVQPPGGVAAPSSCRPASPVLVVARFSVEGN